MSFNVAAYMVYLILTVFMIVVVGKLFYRNGRVFILGLMKGDEVTTDQLNHLLLVAYYLLNIGYGFVKLRFWQKVENLDMLISSIASNMSLLIFILASTHYMNMLMIWFLSRSKKSLTNKSFQS